VLHSLSESDGKEPLAGLIADASSNLYGTTVTGGAEGLGTIFRLSESAAIPEPATWGMMIAGFGLVGAGLRLRRRR
jgi:uncharacterized repeat protein (TIGR03803 family)